MTRQWSKLDSSGKLSITFTCLGEKKKRKDKKPSISQSHFVWMSSTRCVTLPGETQKKVSRLDTTPIFMMLCFGDARSLVQRLNAVTVTGRRRISIILFFFSPFFPPTIDGSSTVTAKRTKSKCSKL